MFVAAGGVPDGWLLVWTMVGGYLAAGGANAINHYIDRDIDGRMARTDRRGRWWPGGSRPGARWPSGSRLGALSALVLGTLANWLAAALALLGLALYVGVYTLWLKRTTVHNIVIGGSAGAVPPLVGWAAVTGDLSLTAWLLFAIVFYWTPPHFWALALMLKRDYAAAGVPMLPVVRGEAETKRQILLWTRRHGGGLAPAGRVRRGRAVLPGARPSSSAPSSWGSRPCWRGTRASAGRGRPSTTPSSTSR